MNDIFFSSDHHFDHGNIIHHAMRPFATIEEMNETLVERWNSVVRPSSTVWYLGDFCWSRSRQAHFLKRLNGRKHYILGNHDSGISAEKGLEWIGFYKFLKANGNNFVLFHYPIKEWDQMQKGSIHLHGHTHSRAVLGTEGDGVPVRRFNVGVEAWDYRPAHIDEIVRLANQKPMYSLEDDDA